MNELEIVSRANPAYVDDLYARWLRDPASVDERWALFFAGFEMGAAARKAEKSNGTGEPATAPAAAPSALEAASESSYLPGVFDLVHSFRAYGHYAAKLNPIGSNAEGNAHLDKAVARFTEQDLDRRVVSPGGFRGAENPTVRELIAKLRTTYCGTFAVQFVELPDKAQQEWLEDRMEPALNRPTLSRDDRIAIWKGLVAAEEFEHFLHTKYVGYKRFSLEGGDSMIPMLETLVECSASGGVRELIMGMAHRGRLNVLAHTLRKPYEQTLAEFEGAMLPSTVPGDGDVKYHQGYSHDATTRQGHSLHLSLSPNPSHLELVNPVIEGMVRAKQDRMDDVERALVVPLEIHGDAAFSGQGIVPETLVLSELPSYETGGTIHIVIDNQVGFTANPQNYRFTPYASDVSRIIHAPVFHVNGDDPEAAVHAARIAYDFRQAFKKDVVIDLVCYRRHGHNETDDPTFTQPLMYEKINAHPTTRKIYEERLIADGVIDQAAVEREAAEVKKRLETALAVAREQKPALEVLTLGGAWKGLTRAGDDRTAMTAVPKETLEKIARACATTPKGFNAHPKVKRLLEARLKALEPGGKVDWGCAEMLAFGSLVVEGTKVRLAGQDSGRGTFSHRHAALRDVKTDKRHVPLDHIDPQQARFEVIDTMLSELAVMGFEYGYSWADPWTLTLWEAQFGDFANGAQALIDVFMAAAESKWQRMSGMTLLLPHGYEGQGPEHSSARLERYLQLCADDNWQVCYPSTPAQYFHVLRRQMRRTFRKPLVIMSPKFLLRYEGCVSSAEDLSQGRFHEVIDDATIADAKAVTRVAICTGKVYYTLLKAREAAKRKDLAIVRVEQLYPFPKDAILDALGKYVNAKDIVWVQEEPWNMGAWHFVETRLRPEIPAGRVLRYVGRDEAASPACGSQKKSDKEEKHFVEEALA